MGRPSSYTSEIAEDICSRLSTGEPLAQICRDDAMPAYRTVYDWMAAHDDFSANIARAREAGFDQIAMDCLDIADDKSGDVRFVGEDEREVCNTEFVQRAKLRIETRLKLLAKWDPKRYGDKMALVGGDPAQGDQPIDVAYSNRDRAKAMAALVAKQRG
jgi:hypothetical protein